MNLLVKLEKGNEQEWAADAPTWCQQYCNGAQRGICQWPSFGPMRSLPSIAKSRTNSRHWRSSLEVCNISLLDVMRRMKFFRLTRDFLAMNSEISKFLVVVLCASEFDRRRLMLKAGLLGLVGGEWAWWAIPMDTFIVDTRKDALWKSNDAYDEASYRAHQFLRIVCIPLPTPLIFLLDLYSPDTHLPPSLFSFPPFAPSAPLHSLPLRSASHSSFTIALSAGWSGI